MPCLKIGPHFLHNNPNGPPIARIINLQQHIYFVSFLTKGSYPWLVSQLVSIPLQIDDTSNRWTFGLIPQNSGCRERSFFLPSLSVEKIQTTAPRAQYGLDAPSVFYGFLMVGIASFFVSFLLFFLEWGGVAVAGFVIFLGICLYSLIVATLMGYSSYVGKIKLATKVIKELELKGHEQILDVGCGRGLYLIELAKRLETGKAYGVDLWQSRDLSGNHMEIAIENARLENVGEKVEVQTAEMTSLPFADASFDLVISSLAIHNLSTAQKKNEAVLEIVRVLKPGGKLVLIDMQAVPLHAQLLRSIGWKEVDYSSLNYMQFPPVRILQAVKL